MANTIMGLNTRGSSLILASGSSTRADILINAGLIFDIQRPTVDEASVRLSMIASGAPVEAGADRLGALKALEVSADRPGTLVIGADQILECDGAWFEKPETLDQARDQLTRLSGKRHRLVSAVAVARDNTVMWHHTDQAHLSMRPLGSAFLDRYLDVMGEKVFSSVGGYQIEGLGAQLFDRVDGDHYTILGLPLFPLLGFLRDVDILGR
jgi:septum formation protein